MIPAPPSGDAYLARLAGILNAELSRKEPTIVGLVYDGTNLLLRFRAPYGVGWVQCQVQSSAVGGGGMTYDPATYASTALVDCRADRLQDRTIAVTAGLRYAVFLVPVQYDGAGTKVMYDGAGGRPDAMASVTTWIGLPTAHNVLSASHGDSTAASCVRGDIITGQGASPLWTRLAKGTEAYYLRSGATDVAWAALAAADLTGTALPAGIVTSSLTAVGALNAGSITSGFGAIDIGADALTAGAGTFGGVVTLNSTEHTSLIFNSTYADAATRNWAIFSNYAAYGDLVIRQSLAKDGNPFGGTGRTVLTFGAAMDATFAAGLTATSLTVGANQVVGAQGLAVADATGGLVIDAEARAALNALLARVRTHGLVAT